MLESTQSSNRFKTFKPEASGLLTHSAPSSCASDSASADHCARLEIILTYLLTSNYNKSILVTDYARRQFLDGCLCLLTKLATIKWAYRYDSET